MIRLREKNDEFEDTIVSSGEIVKFAKEYELDRLCFRTRTS